MRLSSKLLIDEAPLQVLPSLAELVGLNEAIFLQQLHYWLQKASFHDKDGLPWVYNTYEDWHKQFPFWSLATMRRIIGKLEVANLIESTREHNKWKQDQTKWYTINYLVLVHLNNEMNRSE